ncbi:MAG: hypothetical protein ABR575_02110, partial [Actinomycetota bacterium]
MKVRAQPRIALAVALATVLVAAASVFPGVAFADDSGEEPGDLAALAASAAPTGAALAGSESDDTALTAVEE